MFAPPFNDKSPPCILSYCQLQSRHVRPTLLTLISNCSTATYLVSFVAQIGGDVDAAAVVLPEKDDVKGKRHREPGCALVRDLNDDCCFVFGFRWSWEEQPAPAAEQNVEERREKGAFAKNTAI